MSFKYTRAMIHAAMRGDLDPVEYVAHTSFGVWKPQSCPGVPELVLNPRNTWDDQDAYDRQALALANLFVENFKQYEDKASEAIRSAAPRTAL